jgi:hypothetical protein
VRKPAKKSRSAKPAAKQPKPSTKTAAAVLRFSITPVGAVRDEATIVAQIEAARKEAFKKFAAGSPKRKRVEARTEPEGGFLAGGVEWIWLLHVASPYLVKAGEGLATGIGVETAKLLFKRIATALRKRNLRPSEPTVVSSSVNAAAEKPRKQGKRAKR